MTGAGLDRLSLNQRTCARTPLADVIAAAEHASLGGIGLWREPVAEVGTSTAARWVADAGLRVSSLCRGGFFTATDRAAARAADDDNRRAVDEAAELGARTLVLVPGGLPDGSKDIEGARERVRTSLAELATHAADRGVSLAVEPMHPMFAADRGVVSTLAQAVALVADFDPDVVGVVVDSYHLWWEPDIETTIRRAGAQVLGYQVSDWVLPLPAEVLLGRGMMGDGCIDFPLLTRAVADAGYQGDVEVEIFAESLWARPCAEVISLAAHRYRQLVLPYLG